MQLSTTVARTGRKVAQRCYTVRHRSIGTKKNILSTGDLDHRIHIDIDVNDIPPQCPSGSTTERIALEQHDAGFSDLGLHTKMNNTQIWTTVERERSFVDSPGNGKGLKGFFRNVEFVSIGNAAAFGVKTGTTLQGFCTLVDFPSFSNLDAFRIVHGAAKLSRRVSSGHGGVIEAPQQLLVLGIAGFQKELVIHVVVGRSSTDTAAFGLNHKIFFFVGCLGCCSRERPCGKKQKEVESAGIG